MIYICKTSVNTYDYAVKQGEVMREIALDGIDGSGKSTVAQILKEQLEAEGHRVAIHRPYHEAAALLRQDLYDLWNSDDGAQKHSKN